ncbi:MAG: hypothetical protein ABIP48_17335 [Planctomycetota bacterium]
MASIVDGRVAGVKHPLELRTPPGVSRAGRGLILGVRRLPGVYERLVAYHEAGHVVFFLARGFVPQQFYIEELSGTPGEWEGGTTSPSSGRLPEDACFAIMSKLAGWAAERIHGRTDLSKGAGREWREALDDAQKGAPQSRLMLSGKKCWTRSRVNWSNLKIGPQCRELLNN